MRIFQRRVGILILLALLLGVTLTAAQDVTPTPVISGPISVAGSSLMAPMFEALVSASGTTAEVTTQATGTSSGLTSLCNGQVDVALASRSIQLDEDTACQTNGVSYIELLAAYNVLALVSSPQADFAQCLTASNLGSVFAPSSTGQILNWNQVSTANPDHAITAVVPNAGTTLYDLLDRVVTGDGVRSDATSLATEAEILAAVQANTGAVGVVSLPAALAAGSAVRILQLDTTGTGCVAPSADTVVALSYTASERLLVYVNRASLAKPGLVELLTFATSDAGAATVTSAGFTPPTAAVYETNHSALTGEAGGREFTTDLSTFQIPANLSGIVNIAGSANLFSFVNAMKTSFATLYPGVTINLTAQGEADGIRRLCNGEIDIALTTQDLPQDVATTCTANNVNLYNISLGHQAVVLVANANSPYLACLTNAQITTTWGVASANTVTTWNQVDPSFPATNITLVSAEDGSSLSDLLIQRAANANTPLRVDVAESNRSATYRAAAVANVDGGLTYMSWEDYQTVVTNGQANIQLVAVNAGTGCITPSNATIADGTYLLARDGRLSVNYRSLTNIAVQSFLWYTLQDSNFAQLGTSGGFVGVAVENLPELRNALQQAFSQAAVAAAEATPEVTANPEATAESTAEVTATPAP
ncbi:MAG: substrate-binding domain-containing protein [Anaerolineae bacterium]